MSAHPKSTLRRQLATGLRLTASLVLIASFGLVLATAVGAQTEPGTAAGDQHGLMHFLRMKAWSPYAAGTAIGILSWFAFLLSDHPLGVSTAFAKTSGMLEKSLRGEKTLKKDYYQKFPPAIDWEWMLVAGLFIGAFFSAGLSGDFRLSFLPDVWTTRFGNNLLWRWLIAFLGGILVGLGARWAKGCTSGHALSGTMQLVASSWLAALGIFIGGITTAYLVF